MQTVSDCCQSEMIPPDEEFAELFGGSLYKAYLCYICKKCGQPCKPMESEANE